MTNDTNNIIDFFNESKYSCLNIELCVEDYDHLSIYINKKLVIHPGTNKIYLSHFLLDKYDEFHFTWFDTNTIQLSINHSDIQLSVDQSDIQSYYINISNAIDDAYYHIYNYIPKNITVSDVDNALYHTDINNLKPIIVCYNRHGITVLGFSTDRYQLYYSNPDNLKLKLIDTDFIIQYGNSHRYNAVSSCGFINLRVETHQNLPSCYLNNEIAHIYTFV